jgi:hypothetical protein
MTAFDFRMVALAELVVAQQPLQEALVASPAVAGEVAAELLMASEAAEVMESLW